jgi:PAS domain S-box-containing protein
MRGPERICQAVQERPDALNEEFRIVRPSGAVRWIWARTVPIYDTEKQLYRVAGIARDITERKEAEEVIHEQAALLDHAQEAIFVQDLRGKVLYWNRSAVRTYGCTASDIVGVISCRVPRAVQSSTQSRGGRYSKREIGSANSSRNEGRPRNHCRGHWTLVRDEAGAPKSILCIIPTSLKRRSSRRSFSGRNAWKVSARWPAVLPTI